MSTLHPATPSADGPSAARSAAERITEAARRLVRSEDLEEALSVAAASIGEVLGGEAVLRVSTSQHDLYAGASGPVPLSALGPALRGALEASRSDDSLVVLVSTGEHALCRVCVPVVTAPSRGPVELTFAELLLHSLVQAVDRIVTVDRFRQSEANLERAVESHRLVGQAMGILIERHRIVSEEAFDILRRTSQDHNVKLREVAQRVIESGSEPSDVV
ncbi:ANTAR domain-containing protein [Terrabacter terrigena]|uniref:ANTAR domain-containing protein n=1 Tax=Terrabacter terrigena TaxID=574718 RepID=A0ABW3MUG9_9MICO